MVEQIQLITVKELASRLKLSLGAVYSLIANGQIASVRVGLRSGAIRIPESAYKKYIDQQASRIAGSGSVFKTPERKLKHLRLTGEQ